MWHKKTNQTKDKKRQKSVFLAPFSTQIIRLPLQGASPATAMWTLLGYLCDTWHGSANSTSAQPMREKNISKFEKLISLKFEYAPDPVSATCFCPSQLALVLTKSARPSLAPIIRQWHQKNGEAVAWTLKHSMSPMSSSSHKISEVFPLFALL